MPNTSTFVDDVTLDDTALGGIEEEGRSSQRGNIYLNQPSRVEIRVYNLLGEEVRRIDLGVLPAGSHRFVWDGKDSKGRRMPRGSYLMRILTKEGNRTEKVVRL
jgi:flagellar hook assembly protein FlgD